MNSVEELLTTLGAPSCPLAGPLAALWHDANGDWHTAHEVAQGEAGVDGAWVHAYLHRKEGDLANAGYWYRRAQRTMPEHSLQDEWREIAATLLGR